MTSTVVSSLIRTNDLDKQTYVDSVSKLRISAPESLIDTDFEYGLQGVKWETIQLVNNIPTFFSRTGDSPITLSNVQTRSGVEYVYVTTSSNHGLMDGQPILIQGLKSALAEGYYTVNKVISSNYFVYRSKAQQLNTASVYDSATSMLFPGQMYTTTGLTYNQIQSMTTTGSNIVSVTTKFPHGFSSNTYFTITNSVGRRNITFNGTDIATNTFYINNHNFYDYAAVTYRSNVAVGELSGLTDGGTYYVMNTTSNTFQLSSQISPLTAITLGNAGTGHLLTSTDDATDGSFYYLSNIPSACNMLLQAPFDIPVNTYTFNPVEVVNLQSNIIEIPYSHKLPTGAMATYSNGGGTNIGGLTSGTTYYTIRVDASNIRLAANYTNAFNNTNVSMTSLGAGSIHSLTFNNVGGEVIGTGTITLSNASTTVYGSNVNFPSIIRPYDNLYVHIPSATATQYTIASIATNTITVNADIPTGTPLKFQATVVGNLVNNAIYYARRLSTTTISLHPTYTNATGNTGVLTPGAVTDGVLISRTYGRVYETTVDNVLASNRIKVKTAPTVTTNTASLIVQTAVFPFMDGAVMHRPQDGGVELIPTNNPDGQVIRQTRRYFRYQPGKGIQTSLSINFNAPIDIDYASYASLTGVVTAYTKKPHRLSPGLQITVFNQSAAYTSSVWNGTYTVYTVPNSVTFTFIPGKTLTPTVCPGYPAFNVIAWVNSRIRAGMFDEQNGMFFEFDGSNMHCVRRDSVTQLSGYHVVTRGSPRVTSATNVNTQYLTQISKGQMVVIKGMSYKVAHIQSNTIFFIQPYYMGVSDDYAVISLTQDTRTAQTDWSIDTCDGTGPTQYTLDSTKIQMIYMDFSWYGAGKIRYGLKDNEGIVRYVHEYIHNNKHTTAYFRAGNLPARYEICNVGQPTWVPPLLHWGTSVIMDGRYDDDKAYLFTASGNMLSFTNGDTIVVSATVPSTSTTYRIYDPYQQKTVTAWAIVTIGTGGSTFNSVQNIRPQTLVTNATYLPTNTRTLGTPQKDNADANKAYIYIDKQPLQTFTNTSGVTFTLGEATDIIPTLIPIVSIRVCPSVDTSIGGPIGSRELMNRMQLKMKSVDLMTTNDTEIRVILNSILDNTLWTSASSPSLSQLIAHSKNDTCENGTMIFSYRVPGGIFDSSSKRTSQVFSYDISQLGSLGNCILGGDNVYPDGPDIITIAAVNLEAGGVSATTPYTVSARITWAENQA